MDDMECEKCPVRAYCVAYKQARADNQLSYHPQSVVRVTYWDCPLLDLVRKPRPEETK